MCHEMLGVAHALIHGGAVAVVASLWDADDAATALVISRFYDEVSAGASPSTALARAQRYTSSATPAARCNRPRQTQWRSRLELDADDLAIERSH